MEKIKQYIKWVVLGLILALCVTCAIQCSTNRKLQERYDHATTNEKSLLDRIEGQDGEIIEYQSTIATLTHTKDSVIQNLLKQKENLNIRNSELRTMMSMASQYHATDTIRLTDTIFKEPDFSLDTCLQDEWRNMCIGLKYPGDIRTDATMRSQKEVYVTAKRETVEPPKKFFLCRWFQKKHTVTRVYIKEENPYITAEENVYIRVVD